MGQTQANGISFDGTFSCRGCWAEGPDSVRYGSMRGSDREREREKDTEREKYTVRERVGDRGRKVVREERDEWASANQQDLLLDCPPALNGVV